MLTHQKDLFELEPDITYLNGAYMAPQLRSVTDIGIQHLQRKARPYSIKPEDFFEGTETLKKNAAKLMDVVDYRDIALIPSVSYGIANAAENIPFEPGDQILVLEEQFPSNIYAWKRLETTHQVEVVTISPPPIQEGRAEIWNQTILDAISPRTKVIALPHVHWADGTLFDLKTIGEQARAVGAFLIIDGTQSIGALPFSVQEIQPDAVICAAYKWLLGPYSSGIAYYGERFHQGRPIEDNWKNHDDSENFSNLVNYNYRFKPRAYRYEVGESSNFVLTPMLNRAIEQLLEWTPSAIQKYCRKLTEAPVAQLRAAGCFIEADSHRAHHLFGIYLGKTHSMEAIKKRLQDQQIIVSYRGDAIRISPNVYNSPEDLEKLVSCFI